MYASYDICFIQDWDQLRMLKPHHEKNCFLVCVLPLKKNMKKVIHEISNKSVKLSECLIKIIVDYFFRTEKTVLCQLHVIPPANIPISALAALTLNNGNAGWL